MNFDKEAQQTIEKIYNLYKSKKLTIDELKKELKKYNNEVEKKIALGLLAIDKELNLTDIKLSKLLYNNANKIAYKINSVLNEAKRFDRTYKEASMRIYNGYNSGIELLDAKKVLPKYLYEAIDKKKLAKEIEKLQSKNLKAGYKELEKYIKSGSDKALQNLLYVAYNEKLRYYADRIAKTELHRATTNKRAREYLEDSHVEYVRFEMSSSHPKVDICDYYANIDYGYGAGIIKKEDMITLPLHPHCRCIYAPYYGKVKKKAVKDPIKKVMDKFNSYDKRQVLGSYANVDKYYTGTNPLEIFNEVRPDYPIKKFSVGYNGGMDLETMLKEVKSSKKLTKNKIAVGILEDSVIEFLEKRDIPIHTKEIYLTSKGLSHLSRESKKNRGAGLSDEDILKIPIILKEPKTVYFDKDKRKLNLLYCKDELKCGKIIKIVVDTNSIDKKYKNLTLIKTAGYIEIANLRNYDVISGSMESR